MIGLTEFKLIIKGKDSNMKRKVGQRRDSLIAINFLNPKVKFTPVSWGTLTTKKPIMASLNPGLDQKRAGFSHFSPINQPFLW